MSNQAMVKALNDAASRAVKDYIVSRIRIAENALADYRIDAKLGAAELKTTNPAYVTLLEMLRRRQTEVEAKVEFRTAEVEAWKQLLNKLV